jgi:hypothetical protein
MDSSFHWNRHAAFVSNTSGWDVAVTSVFHRALQDTTPLTRVKAKPYGCSASLRSLDTASLAWCVILAPMENRKKHACFLLLMSCIPRN